MKRHKWSDIKARTKPDTRTQIDACLTICTFRSFGRPEV